MDNDPETWIDEDGMPHLEIPVELLMESASDPPDSLDDVLDLSHVMMRFVAQRYVAIDGMRRRAVSEASAFGVDLASVAFRSVRLELAAGMRVSEYVAEAMLQQAEALVHRYPEVWHSLHAGRIDDDKGYVLVAGLDELGPDAAAALLPEALDAAESLQIGPFRRALRKLVEDHRASTLEERHEDAVTRRRVVLETGNDGMAWIGAHMPAFEAQFGRDRYRPPKALRDIVKWRAGRCMGPGCGIPAERCEIDHSVAWEDGGTTELRNLHPLRLSHEWWRSRSGLEHFLPDQGMIRCGCECAFG
ncbi:MAG: hypothetical protein CMH34_02030, partial [Microbacterium sp.]|nr:hypothetical protein [Microbacterium sp.]